MRSIQVVSYAQFRYVIQPEVYNLLVHYCVYYVSSAKDVLAVCMLCICIYQVRIFAPTPYRMW